MKKASIVIIIFLVMLLTVFGAVISFLTVDEYRPDDVEDLKISGKSIEMVKTGEDIRAISWNLGYGALGDNADFFMDGGKNVFTADEERVYQNLEGIKREFEEKTPDIILVQETDFSSHRSFFIDEAGYFIENSSIPVFDGVYASASNYKCSFVPVPIPPMGKVHSGLTTFSRYAIELTQRIQLPCPFKWPLRTFNLKRCLEVSRLPVEDSEKEFVVINLHLEAYDDGEGKRAQAQMLSELMKKEYEKGNYVLAMGDFNQVFSSLNTDKFPILENRWQPGKLDEEIYGDDFCFYADEEVASCRSLDQPLNTAESNAPDKFQYYIIDGAIVSSNIEVENCYVDDLGFVSTDHNPVIMDFKLKK